MPDSRSRSHWPAVLLLMVLSVAASVLPAAEVPDLPPGERPAPDAFARLARAGAAADHEGADHVLVLDHQVNRVQDSGVTYVELYTLTKVLTAAGARELSTLSWGYDPQSSFVDVREVSVLRGGERLAVDVAGVRDLPAPQRAIYWGDRVKALQLPRLEVGDGIEVIAYRKGFTYALLAEGGAPPRFDGAVASQPEVHAGHRPVAMDALEIREPGDDRYIPPDPGQYFDIVLFQADVPVLEKYYEVVLPAAKRLHAQVYNAPVYSKVRYDQEHTTYAWWALDMPARVREPRQAAASDLVAKVVLTTARSWEAKSSWFADVNRNQFAVTPAIEQHVQEVLRAAGAEDGTQAHKAKVLSHWVAQNIRYSGQTMGAGEGFTLHPSDVLFEYRSGVCKDIASMLVTFFRAAGMESHPAMTMAGSRIEDLPADQFNHCVTALRTEDGAWRMYDPTWVPFTNDTWSKLETEQQFLIGSPAGEDLATIAYSPPEESPLRLRHQATLALDGSLSGTFRLEGAGALDGRLRRTIAGTRLRERPTAMARMLAKLGPQVEDVVLRHRDPEDFTGDMWIEVDYRLPRYAVVVDGGLELSSPMLNLILDDATLFPASTAVRSEQRTTDLFLYHTQLIDGRETLRLPAGWRLAAPFVSEQVDETYAAFAGRAEQQGGELVVTATASIKRRQIPPDGYGGVRAAVARYRELAGEPLRIEKEVQ